jgi:hypothetical protein
VCLQGELPPATYARNLGLLWLFFFGFIGGPVAAQTYPMSQQPLQFFLAAGSGGLVPVVFVALRVYLGWKYVGNRLLSAVVEYEETGWYATTPCAGECSLVAADGVPEPHYPGTPSCRS